MQLERRGAILWIRFAQAPTAADCHAVLRAISGESGFVSRSRLWDFRGVGLDLSATELRALADQARWADGGSPARLAALADADLSFGLARMFEAFRQSDSIETAVFRDEEEAVAWLSEPFSSGPEG